MPLSEFSIIDRYFIAPAHPCAREFSASMHVKREPAQKTLLGIGDDAALIAPPAGEALAISVDTLVAGRHFPKQTTPADIGYKALAVNLSDMAAMGATPHWVTLSLVLPEVDEEFLQPFSEHFLALAKQHDTALIGGDTVRGPLTISVQIIGSVTKEEALKRSGAEVGDAIFVSGTLGDAAAGLSLQGHSGSNDDGIDIGAGTTQDAKADERYLIDRLNRPTPRVALGIALRGLATAAIDISDGLLADLGHILEQSRVGAAINSRQLPSSNALKQLVSDHKKRVHLMATGGDDYELCFTVPISRVDKIEQIAEELALPLTQIGIICESTNLELLMDGEKISPKGFDHFKDEHHG